MMSDEVSLTREVLRSSGSILLFVVCVPKGTLWCA